jgi:hypothetical protein
VGEVVGNVGLLALVIEEVLLKIFLGQYQIPNNSIRVRLAASSEMVLFVSVPVVITFRDFC